jgi:glycerophosphoryl diester phosphodiesterase
VGTDPISRLDELLDEFPECTFNIDVKESAAIAPLIDLIRRTDAWHRVCVTSFSARRLAAVRDALGPALVTALSPPEVLALAATARGRRYFASRAERGACVQVPEHIGRATLVDKRLIDTAHRLGMPVHVWTVNDEAAMRRLIALGVDGIMTDEVTLLLRVIGVIGESDTDNSPDRGPERTEVRHHARHDDGLPRTDRSP